MPQLDKFAFAPQVFWLVLVFFVLYLVILKDGLSTLYKILFFRKKSIQLHNSQSTLFVLEATFVNATTNNALSIFVCSKFIVDTIFKLLDFSLAKKAQRYLVLRAVRRDLRNSVVHPRFIAVKHSLLPLVKRYSSVKFA